MPKSYRRWIYEILEEENHANGWPNRVNLALMLLVVLNVVAVIMETVNGSTPPTDPFLKHSMYFHRNIHHQYILRIWSCIEDQDTALLRATDCALR